MPHKLTSIQKMKSDDNVFSRTQRLHHLWPISLYCLVLMFAVQHLLRTDPVEDGEGFFIALFTKRDDKNHSKKQATCRNNSKSLTRDGCTSRFRSGKKRIVINVAHTKLFLMWLHAKQSRRKRDNFNTGDYWLLLNFEKYPVFGLIIFSKDEV